MVEHDTLMPIGDLDG